LSCFSEEFFMDRPLSTPVDSRAAVTTTTVLDTIALILLIVGGVNWALVGLFNLDVVAAIFGPMSTVSRIVYVVVGIAALYALSLLPRLSRRV
jgi:uncharacterized protein